MGHSVSPTFNLTRALSRRVLNHPQQHSQVKHQIVSHISPNNDLFMFHISNGFHNEQIHILEQPPRYHHSLQEYLDKMSHPNSYAGHAEIAAAQQLYGLAINIIITDSATFSTPPDPPFNDHMHVLYHPHSMHYSTLTLTQYA